MTAPVTGSTGVATTTATPSVDRPDQFSNDIFLKLLVAQMKYQDPMNPASSSDFMNQTATFTQVQSLQQIAQQNTQLLALQRSLNAGALVGHQASYTDTDGATKTGLITAVRISAADNTSQAVINGKAVDLGRITEVSLPSS